MDIIHDLNRKKKKSEHTSARLSQGKATGSLKDDEYMLNGEIIKMAPDLKDLPEFNCDDPASQAWTEASEQRFKDKYGKITHEEMCRLIEIQKHLRQENPDLTPKIAANLAWDRFQQQK